MFNCSREPMMGVNIYCMPTSGKALLLTKGKHAHLDKHIQDAIRPLLSAVVRGHSWVH
jgi:hypothetical protein